MAVRRVIAVAVALLVTSLFVPSPANAAGRTWWAQSGWAGAPAYRPHRLWISGDGAFFTQKMVWAHWGTWRAWGHGVAAVDDCDPNCASGTYHYYRVNVRLADAQRRCGHRFFTRLVVVYPDKHPAGSASRLVFDPYRVYC